MRLATMHPKTARVASLSLAIVLTTASFVVLLSGVPVAAANEGTASIVQDGECRELTMYGDSTESISSYYDYRSHETDDVGRYSSYGTRELQRTSESQLFVYNGSQGISLAFVHDRLGDERGGGQMNATLTDLPADGEWAVEDDDYPRRNDSFVREGDRSDVEWYWRDNRTDGGAFRGLSADGITVEAEFNDEIQGWTARDADGDHVDLLMDSPVTVRAGGCGRTPPSAALTASPDTVEPGEQVTFDASDSGGDNITGYRWDLDGDGETDRVTESATTTRAYDSAGTRTATVDVVDERGNAATASADVTVEEADSESPPNASVTVPDTATLGETVTVDASDSEGDDITEYRWDLTGDGAVDRTTADSTVERGYEAPGTRTVTVTVVDGNGNQDDATGEIEVTDETPPTVEADVPDNGTVGESLTLTASGSSDDHEVADVNWTFGDGASATGEEVTHTFDEAGSYEVTVTVSDPSGNTAQETVDVSVDSDPANETEERGDSGDGGDGGDGSNGSNGDSGSDDGTDSGGSDDNDNSGDDSDEEQNPNDGDANDGDETQQNADDSASGGNGAAGGGAAGGGQSGQTPPATTANTARNGDSLEIAVRNARPGEAVQFDLPVDESVNGTVSVELVPAESADSVSATVTTDDVGGFRADAVPVALAVSDQPALETSAVTYTVQVDRAALDHPDDAALYRRNGGEWQRLGGTETRETLERYHFEATADEFSTVALAVRRPNVSVTDVDTGGELRADETNNVTATLRNEGTAAATETVSVTLDGGDGASRTVTVPANETETVTMPVVPDEVGEASLAVNGESTAVAVIPSESSGVVREVTVNYQQVTARTPVDVTATVVNDRSSALTREVTFRTDDGVVATETVTIPAGESSDVTVSLRFDQPGAREITVGEAATSVQVVKAENEEPTTNASSESKGMPGFGLGIALVAVCLSVLVAFRRLP
jgi:hypothetical protein